MGVPSGQRAALARDKSLPGNDKRLTAIRGSARRRSAIETARSPSETRMYMF